MSQTLLTNKKQGKKTSKYMPLTSFNQPSFAFTVRNMFISMKNQMSAFKI
jgi:hypothetical protein